MEAHLNCFSQHIHWICKLLMPLLSGQMEAGWILPPHFQLSILYYITSYKHLVLYLLLFNLSIFFSTINAFSYYIMMWERLDREIKWNGNQEILFFLSYLGKVNLTVCGRSCWDESIRTCKSFIPADECILLPPYYVQDTFQDSVINIHHIFLIIIKK